MSEPASKPLRFDEFELDEENAQLTHRGRRVPLPPKAFAVLCELARQPGKLTTKADLLDAVWGHRHVSESVLKTTISQLRSALADSVSKPRYIETASRRGYRFIGLVGRTVATPAAPPTYTPEAPEPPPKTNSALIGRRPALAQLHAAWRRVVAGARSVFWIGGDAGVGKTTLVDAFTAELGDVLIVRGQCVEQYGAGEPYLPILEALSALSRKHPEIIPMMRTIAPTWLVQLPWLISEADRAALFAELSGANQQRKVRELAELLGRFTEQRPLLLITEDLHWSDDATLRLLDHFARRPSPARVMWLSTFRLMQVIAEAHPLKELRQELRLHRLCEEVVLDPFSEVEVAEYLARRLPGPAVHEAFIHKLHDHTGGLPLFVVNVVDNLAAQTSVELADDSRQSLARTAWSVPDNLAGAIEKQIARLPTDLQRLLETASVCGTEFRVTALSEVLQQDLAAVSARCDELAQGQYWLQHLEMLELPGGALDARYGFRHALYRHVFYQRLGAPTRVQLHRRVAEALERSRSIGALVAATELASQYEAGLAHAAALSCYVEAARSALTYFAPKEALDITGHALTLLPRCPEGPERLELEYAIVSHRGIACSQVFGLASPEGEIAYQRALTLADVLPPSSARAQTLSGLAWMYYIRGEYDQARALGARLQSLSQELNDPVLVVASSTLLGVLHTIRGEFTKGRNNLERGLEACIELGENIPHSLFVADPIVVLRANLAIALLHLGLIDSAQVQMDLALARAEQRGQLMARTIALWCTAMFAMRMRRPEFVRECAQKLDKLVVDNVLVQAEGPRRWIAGWAEAYLGSPRSGLRLILEGWALNQRLGMISGAAEVIGYAVEALILAEDWPQAQARLDEARQLSERLGERILFTYQHMLQGRIELGRGDVSAARQALHAGVDEARSQGSIWMQLRMLAILCQLPDATPRDLEALRQVYGQLREGFGVAAIAEAGKILSTPAY